MKVTERPTADFIDATTIDIASDIVDQTFRVTVVTPFLYEAMEQNLPVLYILDGFICLPMASSIALSLQANAFGVAPPVICVGISYATDNPIDIFSLRRRDLTPTEGTPPPHLPNTHGTGGAPKFLEALTNEIIPTVEDRWRVDPNERCLVGWSIGGLFGLYALFNRPDAFSKYLLVSPSIWWDDEAILRDEERYASSHDDLRAKVFACVGEREEAAPSRMWPPQPSEELYDFMLKARMVSSLDGLVATLRGRRYPGLELASHVFEDEHHVTVFPAGFARGLRTLCV